ncbi:MAG: AMP-binding protein, partial [Acetobacteraceae bacterium]|nr:AMP-binding protein [Acetobacteraceae bacterium]
MPAGALRHHDWIASHAARRPGAPAAIDLGTGARLTYGAFHDRIDGVAAWLAEDCGIGAGDRVAVLAQAGIEVFAIQFACFRLGAILVPLNLRLAPPELAAILTNCTPALLLHDNAFAALAAQVVPEGSTTRLASIDPGSRFALAAAGGHRPARRAEMALQDVATILYTSGTTGLPKGVMVTHAMNLFNAVNLGGLAGVSDRSVNLVVLPLFHTGGLNVFANPVFHAGGTVVVAPGFDPGAALHALGDPALGINLLFGVPAHYQFPVQHPDFATTDLSRLAHAGVGGAPAPLPVIEAWQARGVLLTQGYGMTETGPVVLYLDKEDAVRKVGSAGKPVLHVDIRLVDAEGEDVADGAVGEIWLRGPSITPGYWNNPEATAAAFHDGWLRTGDAAMRDAEGYVFIVDRWKDMYISGGENVYPAEVENVLSRL